MDTLRPDRIYKPDYEDPKEPWAFFGLACYFAQCFEQSVILLIVALRVTSSTPIVEKSFNEIFSKLDKKTLGCLLKEVSTFTEIVDGTLDRLMSLLKMRNYLVHHYWVNNSTKSLTGAGRKSILDELNEIVQNFKDGDNLVVGIYTPLWAKLGANEDTVKQELEKLKAE